jgi:hypothetical protein
MKTYKVFYSGTVERHKGITEEAKANSRREAVEKVYRIFFDTDYFPQDDGSILNDAGNVIATATDETIEMDGGFLIAEEI